MKRSAILRALFWVALGGGCTKTFTPASQVEAATTSAAPLLGGDFAGDVAQLDCDAARSTPFFSGIQAHDDTLLTRALDGDVGSANLYVLFGNLAANSSASAVHSWNLLQYYNRASLNASGDAEQEEGTLGTLTSRSRDGSSTLRFATRNAAGHVVRWGDQLETRMLGLWAGAPDPAMEPGFQWAGGATDAQDFSDYTSQVIDTDAWRAFMRQAALAVAGAFKCGDPVYAHSGGGAVVAVTLRLLAQQPALDFAAWSQTHPFTVIGLEATLSQEVQAAVDAEPAYAGAVDMTNYVVTGGSTTQGSPTWRGTISEEIEQMDGTPLVTAAVEVPDLPGWSQLMMGHAALAFYTLARHFPAPSASP